MNIFRQLLIGTIFVKGYDTCKKEGEVCKNNFECCAMLNCVKLSNIDDQNTIDNLILHNKGLDGSTDKFIEKKFMTVKNAHLPLALQNQLDAGSASICLQHKTIKLYQ